MRMDIESIIKVGAEAAHAANDPLASVAPASAAPEPERCTGDHCENEVPCTCGSPEDVGVAGVSLAEHALKSRRDVGLRLAERLRGLLRRPALVYALPRNGVRVASAIAQCLRLPLDLVVSRRIPHPFAPAESIGAVTELGRAVYDTGNVQRFDTNWIRARIDAERVEARRQRDVWCGARPRQSATGRCVILVDDAAVTGMRMQAAIAELRAEHPQQIIVALGVASQAVVSRLRELADQVVVQTVLPARVEGVSHYFVEESMLDDKGLCQHLRRAVVHEPPQAQADGAANAAPTAAIDSTVAELLPELDSD